MPIAISKTINWKFFCGSCSMKSYFFLCVHWQNLILCLIIIQWHPPKKEKNKLKIKLKSTVYVLTHNQGICFEFGQYNIHVWNKHTRITAIKLLHTCTSITGKLPYCPYTVAISLKNLDAKHRTPQLYRHTINYWTPCICYRLKLNSG